MFVDRVHAGRQLAAAIAGRSGAGSPVGSLPADTLILGVPRGAWHEREQAR